MLILTIKPLYLQILQNEFENVRNIKHLQMNYQGISVFRLLLKSKKKKKHDSLKEVG
jgi:hypothetical protein